MSASQVLSRGQNTDLTTNSVVVGISIDAAADLSALLVTAAGMVRSDEDLIFFNHREGPGVFCRQVGPHWFIEVDLALVPSDIEQIRTVISLEGDKPFGTVAVPVAQISDGDGNLLVEYPIAGLESESIVIAVEIYRRNAGWKIRAVGQGYAGGLSDLLRDHGVSVEEDGEAAVPVPPIVPQTPATPPQTAAGPMSLAKGTSVSLVKGQSISLVKEDGALLTQVRMGLGWDAGVGPARTHQIDLDASAILFAGTKEVETVSYKRLRSKDRTVQHSGDNLTGHGGGDDETISVNLGALPADTTTVIFAVTSYRGQTFDRVANAHCRLLDGVTGEELVRYTLGDKTPHRGMVMAKLVRGAGGWQMHAIGEGIDAKTPNQAASLSVPFV